MVYTRTDSPGLSVYGGNRNVGAPSAISVSVQPPMFVEALPKFWISTYSSASVFGTMPSKKMQTIPMLIGAGAVVGVGVVVGVAGT